MREKSAREKQRRRKKRRERKRREEEKLQRRQQESRQRWIQANARDLNHRNAIQIIGKKEIDPEVEAETETKENLRNHNYCIVDNKECSRRQISILAEKKRRAKMIMRRSWKTAAPKIPPKLTQNLQSLDALAHIEMDMNMEMNIDRDQEITEITEIKRKNKMRSERVKIEEGNGTSASALIAQRAAAAAKAVSMRHRERQKQDSKSLQDICLQLPACLVDAYIRQGQTAGIKNTKKKKHSRKRKGRKR